jgi:uncharacterized protein YraI
MAMKAKRFIQLLIVLVALGLFVIGCVPLTPGEAVETAAVATEAEEEVEVAATPTSISSSTSTEPAFQLEVVVTAKALNVRGGPGVEYDKIGLVYEGDVLTVTACNHARDWLAVTLPDGTEGWVSAGHVESETSLDDISVASVIPTPPMQTPTLVSEEPTSTPVPAEPPPPASVDDQLADIAKGEHGELPQPGTTGGVDAGGLAEVTIINDTPDTLTILIGAPNSIEITIEPCPTCKHYKFVGPVFCREEGRTKQTLRLQPGTCQVAARVDDPTVNPFHGEWTLEGDTAYFNCFYILTKFKVD